jgi:hypothetical protein
MLECHWGFFSATVTAEFLNLTMALATELGTGSLKRKNDTQAFCK